LFAVTIGFWNRSMMYERGLSKRSPFGSVTDGQNVPIIVLPPLVSRRARAPRALHPIDHPVPTRDAA
jgi:hypothetical protein